MSGLKVQTIERHCVRSLRPEPVRLRPSGGYFRLAVSGREFTRRQIPKRTVRAKLVVARRELLEQDFRFPKALDPHFT